MQTRQEDDFWPFSRGLEIEFTLIGRLPPTVEDVMVKFRSLHQYNQQETNRQSSSLEDAAKQIAKEAQNLWIRPGYQIQRENNLSSKILKIDKQWKNLSRDNKKIINKTMKLTPAIEKE